MKILITGKNGQLGQSLQSELGDNVSVYAYSSKDLDISNKAKVDEIVALIKPDFIVNAAAYTAVDKAESEVEQARAVNVAGSENLAIAASKNDTVLIHVSTDYVFNGAKDSPYNEDDDTDAQGVYGKTKLEGELAVASNCHKHIIIRTAWVFSEYGSNFVKTMLRLAASHPELKVVSDQVGGPTYARDIAKAIVQIITQVQKDDFAEWGTYHFSGEPYISWHGFALNIFENAAKNGIIDKAPEVHAIPTSDYPTPAKRPAFSKLDHQKIKRVFGINPSNWLKALQPIEKFLN